MENKFPLLGLDIGDRRIGVALAVNPSSPIVPLITLSNNRAFFNELVKLKSQYHFVTIIAGMPYTFNGQPGEQARKVQEVIEKIEAKLGLKVEIVDERFSTRAASERLEPSGSPRADIDALSAQVILEGWIAANSA